MLVFHRLFTYGYVLALEIKGVRVTLTVLSSNICVPVPIIGPEFHTSFVVVFCMFCDWGEKELFVLLISNGEIADHHCYNFLFLV